MPLLFQAVNIDCCYPDHYAYEKARIEAAGANFVLRRSDSPDEIVAACAGADVVVVERSSRPFNGRMMDGMPKCREIVSCGIGYDGIDVEAASRRGIVVCNMAGYCTDEVADHAVGMILASVRRFRAMNRVARSGAFVFPIEGLRRVNQLTLGLIGFGGIARGVAQRMAGFHMRILAYVRDPKRARPEPGVEFAAWDDLLRQSDVISLHLPLTPETRGIIGERAFQLMKPTALLVNTGRGLTVDQDALIRALREKRLAGVALDVMAEEPLPVDSPLCAMEDLILTPHYGGVSEDSERVIQKEVADSVEAAIKGYWPPHPVNPAMTPRFPLKPWSEFRPDAR